MRNIARGWGFALIVLLLAPWAGAQPENTGQVVSAEIPDPLTQQEATESAPEGESEPTVQDQWSQLPEIASLSTAELASNADSPKICSGNAPPSCQCGSCCECFTCWRGPILLFGCDI